MNERAGSESLTTPSLSVYERAKCILAASKCVIQTQNADNSITKIVTSPSINYGGNSIHLTSAIASFDQPPTIRPRKNGSNPEPVTINPGGPIRLMINVSEQGPDTTAYILRESGRIVEMACDGHRPTPEADVEVARFVGSMLDLLGGSMPAIEANG